MSNDPMVQIRKLMSELTPEQKRELSRPTYARVRHPFIYEQNEKGQNVSTGNLNPNSLTISHSTLKVGKRPVALTISKDGKMVVCSNIKYPVTNISLDGNDKLNLSFALGDILDAEEMKLIETFIKAKVVAVPEKTETPSESKESEPEEVTESSTAIDYDAINNKVDAIKLHFNKEQIADAEELIKADSQTYTSIGKALKELGYTPK